MSRPATWVSGEPPNVPIRGVGDASVVMLRSRAMRRGAVHLDHEDTQRGVGRTRGRRLARTAPVGRRLPVVATSCLAWPWAFALPADYLGCGV